MSYIVIFSKDKGETTTDNVMDWIFASNIENIVRINGEDLIFSDFNLKINSSFFEFKDNIINPHKVKTVWFRRTYDESVFDNVPFFNTYGSDKTLELHLMGELGRIYFFFEYFFLESLWVNKYSQRIDKLKNICIAIKYGLKVPFTVVTNSTKHIKKKIRK
ncbi:hypothetical protein MTP09_12330 [Chryseobacterium suipulveris]|uniref:Uncharacterized protein n=1 Tax=Chryseobacterium suipulveris TaxID=2929800 RepID=A0ABY4BSL1_9FLAO|nr:hypothetical protein [Chryseobacterium suipulveris]UOE40678.1 hypothetical protein MTP09_12330 [Chryseobacterium suipulveris]